MIEPVALSVTAALLPVGTLLVAMHIRMLQILRTRHKDMWVSLGSPRLWFAKTFTETRATLGFLWRRDYRALGDNRFSRLCGVVRVLYLLFGALFVVASMLFLIIAYQKLGVAA